MWVRSVDEVSNHLGFYVFWAGKQLPTFPKSIVLPFRGQTVQEDLDFMAWKTEVLRSSDTIWIVRLRRRRFYDPPTQFGLYDWEDGGPTFLRHDLDCMTEKTEVLRSSHTIWIIWLRRRRFYVPPTRFWLYYWEDGGSTLLRHDLDCMTKKWRFYVPPKRFELCDREDGGSTFFQHDLDCTTEKTEVLRSSDTIWIVWLRRRKF